MSLTKEQVIEEIRKLQERISALENDVSALKDAISKKDPDDDFWAGE